MADMPAMLDLDNAKTQDRGFRVFKLAESNFKPRHAEASRDTAGLERAPRLQLIRAMAARKPERVVCLDEGFAGNDQLKANAVQIFKTQGVTSFKTV